MNQAANVQSIDAIRQFRQELKRYLESLRNVLDSLKLESNKAMSWIDHDRATYWPRAARKADDALVVARNALSRCKMARMEGQRKSCQEEKVAVEQANRRLRHCESRINAVRQWRHRMRHHTEEFSGRIARLTHFADNDIPKALAALDRIIAALEKYAATQIPTSNGPGAMRNEE